MDLTMKTILVIGQALSFAELRASAFEGPEDTIAYLGGDVTIRCASETRGCSKIDWRRRLGQSNSGSPGSWGYEPIFKNNFLINVDVTRYSVDNTSGCHVVIRNIQYGDSGRYSCEAILSDKSTTVKSGYLIVLKSSPECKVRLPLVSDGSVKEGDEVTFTCESTYAGEEGYMTWKGVENASKAETVDRTHTLSYSVVVGASGVPSLVCEVRFTSQSKVTDVNSLMVSCQTPTIEILYAVKSAILSPSLSVYSPGTLITCFSGGNPSPSYIWQIKNVISDGKSENWKNMFGETDKELIVDIATYNFYRCVARNTIRGSSYVAISEVFQVNYIHRESENSTTLGFRIAFFFYGVVCTLLLVISIVCLLKRLRYIQFRRKSTPEAASDVGQREYMNMEIVGGIPSAAQAVAPGTRDEGDVTAYASLGDDCAENRPYESLGARPNRLEIVEH